MLSSACSLFVAVSAGNRWTKLEDSSVNDMVTEKRLNYCIVCGGDVLERWSFWLLVNGTRRHLENMNPLKLLLLVLKMNNYMCNRKQNFLHRTDKMIVKKSALGKTLKTWYDIFVNFFLKWYQICKQRWMIAPSLVLKIEAALFRLWSLFIAASWVCSFPRLKRKKDKWSDDKVQILATIISRIIILRYLNLFIQL